ncbi:hypothetical protein GDO81_018427 [Engystomops pustulosus]|uniref:Uncharacterized protein n=1 Tax=Engystomops pustulosus TaxID=76066 RepID=A0AAV6ZNW5_ENGPU|nr:hypothetical protein GDO81_018427 [Engystomops pustulosus]
MGDKQRRSTVWELRVDKLYLFFNLFSEGYSVNQQCVPAKGTHSISISTARNITKKKGDECVGGGRVISCQPETAQGLRPSWNLPPGLRRYSNEPTQIPFNPFHLWKSP